MKDNRVCFFFDGEVVGWFGRVPKVRRDFFFIKMKILLIFCLILNLGNFLVLKECLFFIWMSAKISIIYFKSLCLKIFDFKNLQFNLNRYFPQLFTLQSNHLY